MTIDKIGGIGGSGYEPKRTTPVKKAESKETFDNVSISDTAKQKASEARLQAEVQTITRKILSTPNDSDRSVKLKEIKEKLKNGDYDNLSSDVLNTIADRISETMLGQ
ncbi:flagellar biosynthesis anti-sigma factor FlgM [Leptospira borgpetersenii]|uniref:flagellar biosynthesis anti-sigma factor FlgM n=1 Tax=Leptospira borgpetersenii TaxID=174 RepID=UPI00077327F6|nr:flagellar biosynthesis anti-sigma factor FlgM [Leptospira borgpetersenii]